MWDGKKLDDGTIDWQKPVSLEKIPVAVNMNELDFYPENYESELDKYHWEEDKKSRDSLYLSLDEKFIAQREIADTKVEDNSMTMEEELAARKKDIQGQKSYLKRRKRAPIMCFV